MAYSMPLLMEHNYFVTMYLRMLPYQKRIYQLAEQYKQIDVVDEYEKKIENHCNAVGRHIAEWFRDLLYLAEKGWIASAAFELDKKILECKTVLKHINALKSNQEELYNKLVKLENRN